MFSLSLTFKKFSPRQQAACLFLGIACLFAVGCGGGKGDRQKTVPVKGTVTFSGTPVPHGSLLFVPVNSGPPAQANLKTDGTFTVGTYDTSDGMIPGEYRVTISGQMVAPDPNANETPDADAVLPDVKPLPNKYGAESTSGLTVTISETEKNELTFDLTP